MLTYPRVLIYLSESNDDYEQLIMKALKCKPSLKSMSMQSTSTHTHPMYTVKKRDITEYSARTGISLMLASCDSRLLMYY